VVDFAVAVVVLTGVWGGVTMAKEHKRHAVGARCSSHCWSTLHPPCPCLTAFWGALLLGKLAFDLHIIIQQVRLTYTVQVADLNYPVSRTSAAGRRPHCTCQRERRTVCSVL
jgi:hypothetical protein